MNLITYHLTKQKMFYKDKILNSSQLRKLAEHKYSVESASLLEPYLQVIIECKQMGDFTPQLIWSQG